MIMIEEEIINKANLIIENHREIDKMMVIEMVDLIQGLLDLYQKEKEKNKEYEEGTILSEKQANMVFQAIKEGATEQITKEMKNYIHKDKIREKLLNPVQEEGEKINKEFFKKDKGHFVESFCVEGAILQELGAIEGMILELLEESK